MRLSWLSEQVLMPPLRLSSARLSVDERQEFDDVCADPAKLQSLLANCTEKPFEVGQPANQQKRALEVFIHSEEVPQVAPRLSWVRPVCVHRAIFKDSFFKITDGDISSIYKFIYGMISPAYICFAAMENMVNVERSPEVERALFRGDYLGLDELFRVRHMEFVFTSDGFISPGAKVEVLMDAENVEGPYFGASLPWRRLETVLATLQEAKPQKKESLPSLAKKRCADRAVFEDNPWLLDFLGLHVDTSLAGTKALTNSGAETPPDGDIGVEAQEHDEGCCQIASVFEELVAKRLELADGEGAEHFAWKVRGGQWTARNKGCAFDCFAACAVSFEGKDMCKSYSLPSSASFSLKLYGERQAVAMCEYWLSKHKFWFDIWRHYDCPVGRRFEQRELDAFEEPAEFAELARLAAGAVAKRVAQLRALHPHCGV